MNGATLTVHLQRNTRQRIPSDPILSTVLWERCRVRRTHHPLTGRLTRTERTPYQILQQLVAAPQVVIDVFRIEEREQLDAVDERLAPRPERLGLHRSRSC